MKKVMLVAATCAALTGVCDVTSDCVGYLNQSSPRSVKQMMAAPFLNCAGEAIDIQDISCKDGTKNPAAEAFSMWWYDTTAKRYIYAIYTDDVWVDDGTDDDAGTEYMGKFFWVTDDGNYFVLAPLGWKYDDSALPSIRDHEKRFQPGEGFFIQAGVNTPIVTVSGKVVNPGENEEFATVALSRSVKQMVTNPFPIGGYDIQDISCKDGTKDPAAEAFSMWWYDTTAKRYIYAIYTDDVWVDDGTDDDAGTEYMGKFFWVTDDGNYFVLAPLGWKYDDSALPSIRDHEKRFIAGESFFVQAGVNSPFVRFKNPFYKGN